MILDLNQEIQAHSQSDQMNCWGDMGLGIWWDSRLPEKWQLWECQSSPNPPLVAPAEEDCQRGQRLPHFLLTHVVQGLTGVQAVSTRRGMQQGSCAQPRVHPTASGLNTGKHWRTLSATLQDSNRIKSGNFLPNVQVLSSYYSPTPQSTLCKKIIFLIVSV